MVIPSIEHFWKFYIILRNVCRVVIASLVNSLYPGSENPTIQVMQYIHFDGVSQV